MRLVPSFQHLSSGGFKPFHVLLEPLFVVTVDVDVDPYIARLAPFSAEFSLALGGSGFHAIN